MTFPWLINKNRLFKCNICVSAKTLNVFISGKDHLVKHQGSADHWRLVVLPKWQGLL